MAEERAWGTTVANVADLVGRAAQVRGDGIALLTGDTSATERLDVGCAGRSDVHPFP